MPPRLKWSSTMNLNCTLKYLTLGGSAVGPLLCLLQALLHFHIGIQEQLSQTPQPFHATHVQCVWATSKSYTVTRKRKSTRGHCNPRNYRKNKGVKGFLFFDSSFTGAPAIDQMQLKTVLVCVEKVRLGCLQMYKVTPCSRCTTKCCIMFIFS